eukprot:463884_1
MAAILCRIFIIKPYHFCVTICNHILHSEYLGLSQQFVEKYSVMMSESLLQLYHLPGKRNKKIGRKVKCVYSSFDCGLFICIIINFLALCGCILTISFHWFCGNTCDTCNVPA